MNYNYSLPLYTFVLIIITILFGKSGNYMNAQLLDNPIPITLNLHNSSIEEEQEPLEATAVANTKTNEFYTGIENHISVAALGVLSEDLRVSISNSCRLKMTTERGKYVVTAHREGEAIVTVKNMITNQIKEFPFIVKRVPNPIIKLGGIYNSTIINAEAFKAQKGLIAVLEGAGADFLCEVVQFELSKIPANMGDDKDIINLKATTRNGVFEGEVREVINQAKTGDIYNFSNIKVKYPVDGRAIGINGLIFQID